ncbi:hypothetical protein AB0D57_06540 [Streptomyces sp. NPDC048275]
MLKDAPFFPALPFIADDSLNGARFPDGTGNPGAALVAAPTEAAAQ